MGREIKRVPLDFSWPLHEPWEGYLIPDDICGEICAACEGIGLNKPTLKIHQEWYGINYCHNINQADVEALVEAGRLHDFTHTWDQDNKLVRRADNYIPTAQEVNEWSHTGFAHDTCNHFIVTEARAKRLGVYGKCEVCNGAGDVWLTEVTKLAHDKWERSEPPTGEGWQVWETVSEGSPISPVFADKTELINWLIIHERQSRANAEAFVEKGWALTMIVSNNIFYENYESASLT